MQRLPADAPPTFVTLNPPSKPDPQKTIRHLRLAHPVFSYAAYEAQQKLHTAQVSLHPTTDQKYLHRHPQPAMMHMKARQKMGPKVYSVSAASSCVPMLSTIQLANMEAAWCMP